jgi:hypothetical protein
MAYRARERGDNQAFTQEEIGQSRFILDSSGHLHGLTVLAFHIAHLVSSVIAPNPASSLDLMTTPSQIRAWTTRLPEALSWRF